METLEQAIARIVNEKLNDGTVERIVSEKLEKAVSDAMDDVFSYRGKGREELKNRIEGIMVPAIEKHDFNKYLVKMDTVLTEIINNTNLADNERILENFRGLMKEPDYKEIKLSDIFKEYCKHVAENVDTDELEVDTDDTPSYQYVSAVMDVEDTGGRYSSYKECTVTLECEEDGELKIQFRLIKWKEDKAWNIRDVAEHVDINSLRHMSKFEVFLCTLKRAYVDVIIDTNSAQEEVQPEAEPEPEWR